MQGYNPAPETYNLLLQIMRIINQQSARTCRVKKYQTGKWIGRITVAQSVVTQWNNGITLYRQRKLKRFLQALIKLLVASYGCSRSKLDAEIDLLLCRYIVLHRGNALGSTNFEICFMPGNKDLFAVSRPVPFFN